MLKIKTCIGDKEKQWIYTWPLKNINKNHEVIQSYTTHVRQFEQSLNLEAYFNIIDKELCLIFAEET